MWESLERWSWVAGVVSALLALITYASARRDARRAERDRRASEELHVELLKAVRQLGRDPASRLNTEPIPRPVPRTSERPPGDANRDLRIRAQSLSKSAEKRERRSRKLLGAAVTFVGFALFSAVIMYLVNSSILRIPLIQLLDAVLETAVSHNIPISAAWSVSLLVLGALYSLITAPILVRSVHGRQKLRVLEPVLPAIRRKYPQDKQAQASKMQQIQQAAGLNPFSGLIGCATLALSASVALHVLPIFGPQAIERVKAWPPHLRALLPELQIFGAPLVSPYTGDFLVNLVSGLALTVPLSGFIVLMRLRVQAAIWRRSSSLKKSLFTVPETSRTTTGIIIITLLTSIAFADASQLLAIIGYYLVTWPIVMASMNRSIPPSMPPNLEKDWLLS
jgi:60Kd inner membrane protein